MTDNQDALTGQRLGRSCRNRPTRLARAYSYDMLGSFVAVPVGEFAVGPLSSVFGLRTTLVGAAVVILLAMLAALASRSVRDLTND